MERVAASVPASADLLSVTKGLEAGTLLRMSEVIAGAGGFDPSRIAVLSGPNLALEIAHGGPASAVVAADDQALAERVVQRLGSKRFRRYVNQDVLGVELCGALKNVLAIAAGAVDELGWGDNGKAGLITRGLAEMTRLGIAMGANPLTFAGLAGVGDVVATSGSPACRGTIGWASSSRRAAPGPTSNGRCPGPRRGRTRSMRRSSSRGGTTWSCRSRSRSTRRCSKARASGAACSTCSPASRRTSWPTTASGSSALALRTPDEPTGTGLPRAARPPPRPPPRGAPDGRAARPPPRPPPRGGLEDEPS